MQLISTTLRAPVIGALFALAASAAASAQQIIPLNPQNSPRLDPFGEEVAGLSDVNGDGFGDVLVGVASETIAGLPVDSGAAYVFSGTDGRLLYRLLSPAPQLYGGFGTAVAGIGDLDADGVDDLLVGASFENRVHVFSGADGSLIRSLASPGGGGVFGGYLAAVPDADGDGFADIAVSAHGERGGRGRAYLFSGADGTLLHSFEYPEPQFISSFGLSIAGVPDADGDGRGDVLVGTGDDVGNPDRRGRAYLFSGATGELLYTLHTPDKPNARAFARSLAGLSDVDGDGRGDLAIHCVVELHGRVYLYSGATGELIRFLESPNRDKVVLDRFGDPVAATPDLDGDGVNDLVIGSRLESYPGFPAYTGRAYTFSGATGLPLREYRSPNPDADPVIFPYFGIAVSSLPDASGDGRPEILVGSHDCMDECPPTQHGRAYIFHSCPADFTADGAATTDDFFAFLEAFLEARPAADFTRDGSVNSDDFFAFLTAFFDGC